MAKLGYYAFRTSGHSLGIRCGNHPACTTVFRGGSLVAMLLPGTTAPTAVVGYEASCPACKTLQHLPLVYPSPEAAIKAATNMRVAGTHGDLPLIPVPAKGPLAGQVIETLEIVDIVEEGP